MRVKCLRDVGLWAVGAWCAIAASACTTASPQPCHRYEVLSLNPDNDFSGRVDSGHDLRVEGAGEWMEVSLTLAKPPTTPVEIVHVVGDTVSDRWALQVPPSAGRPVAVCVVAPPGGWSGCGATLSNLPVSPGGHYYLRDQGGTVLEAGIAYHLCRRTPTAATAVTGSRGLPDD